MAVWKDLTDRAAQFLMSLQIPLIFINREEIDIYFHSAQNILIFIDSSVMEFFGFSLISLTRSELLHWEILSAKRIYSSSSWLRSNLLIWRKKWDRNPASPGSGHYKGWIHFFQKFTVVGCSLAVMSIIIFILCVTVTVTYEIVFTIPLFTYNHLPVAVARSAAAEVEGEVEEPSHHEGRHHHPRVGDHQAHILQHELATLILIHQGVFIINTLNRIMMSLNGNQSPPTCDKLKWMLNSTIETTAATACKAS